MHRYLILTAVAAIPACAAPAQDQTPGEKARDSVMAAYHRAQEAYQAALREAKSEEARRLAEAKAPDAVACSKRLLAVAKEFPDDPAAPDCLTTVVYFDTGAQTDEALRLLMRYTQSPELRGACEGLTDTRSPAAEPFLRAVLAKSPHREVQAWAHYALARLLARRPGDPAQKEAEQLFQRVTDRFADVADNDGKLGADARRDLDEMRLLGIGRPAPEIEGEDVDGVKFKLSDYRGKVVLLDFWGFW
jgi:hypothetical protein